MFKTIYLNRMFTLTSMFIDIITLRVSSIDSLYRRNPHAVFFKEYTFI